MIKKIERIIVVLLALVMLLGVPVSAALFPDVPQGAWYEKELEMMLTYTPGIISGYPDGTFKPGDIIKRGEFLTMMARAAELITMTPAPSDHWAAPYWQACYENGVLLLDAEKQELVFGCTADELNVPINRYEMAVIVANITLVGNARESRVTVTDADKYIPDYNNIPDKYKDAVEQTYGKGIINGYSDGSFRGDRTLTRCEAMVAAYRFLWAGERKMPEFAHKNEVIETPETTEFVSFAMKYRNMTQAERQTALFGNPNKTYFANAAEAAPYMQDVTVPVWKVDKTGNKYSSQITLTVHKLVAKEVELIFSDIYNDSERFPVVTWGGARFTDKLRHSWGCAIDLNYDQNYYCRTVNGVTTALTGSGWWPGGNQYSITPNGSVVRAFAKYGWGWGGQGYSGGYYDYMHFSILSSGG